jgi:four helix bundle protein
MEIAAWQEREMGKARSQESGVRSQESGEKQKARSQESGVRSQEKSKKSAARSRVTTLGGNRMTEDRKKAKSFSELIVWQKAHCFVLSTYRLTSTFPKQEIYGLISQMRRAAVSIPANIAEGFRRRGKTEKVRFMNIAESSLEESRYYLLLTQDLGYGSTIQLRNELEEVSRLLNAYTRSILAHDS